MMSRLAGRLDGGAGTLVLLVVPLVVLAVAVQTLGGTLSERILTAMFINLTLVVGLQIFMGNSGILSFAHIGFMGIGAYASVLFSMRPGAKSAALPELYPWLSSIQLPFLVALLVGALIASVVAAVISFPLMRLSDAAAVITTFGVLVIIHVVLVHWSEVTNGPKTLFGVDRHTGLWAAVVFAVAFVALAYWFKESGLGLRLRASRDDRFAAAAVGIDMVLVRWAAFVLSAFVAAVGGGLFAHFITSFSPGAFYLTETFVVLAMLVVGGPASVSGAVVGTVVVTAIFEGLRAVENSANLAQIFERPLVGMTEVALAIVLIAILAFRPAGIMAGRELRIGRRTVPQPVPDLKSRPSQDHA